VLRHISDDHFIDFEVTTEFDDPVVTFTSSPIELLSKPADLDDMVSEAKKLGRERGYSFDKP
jgi:hypothetical protein